MQTAKFTKLRWTIIAAGLAVGMVMTVFFVFDRLRQRDQILQSAVHDTTTSAKALAEHTDQVFTSVELLMQHVAADVNGRPSFEGLNREEMHQEFKSYADGAAFIDSLSIQDADGYVFVSSDYVDPPHFSYAYREHFTAQRDDPTHGTYIGPPIEAKTDERVEIPLSMRLNGPTSSGKFAGIVYVAMPVDYFRKFYNTLNVGADGRVRLVLTDGRPLIEEPPQTQDRASYASQPWFQIAQKDGFNGTYQGFGAARTDERIISFRKVEGHPLIVLVSFSRDEVLKPWRESNWIAGGIFSALMLMVLAACIGMLRMVSERERWADVTSAAQIEAEQANKAKSDFLASMSHEIRTPLNGILGFAQLLQGSALNEMQKRYVSFLTDAGNSLLAIINDILDLSKIEAGKLTLENIPFGPVSVVDSAIATIRPQAADKKLAVEAIVEADVPECLLGDSTRLRQILLNLLGNAIKFTEKGRIGVVVRSLGRGVRGAKVRFEVSDTGIGIAEDKLNALFQNFSQVDNSIARRFGGTGLGLAISKRLAEAMGGEIGVVSVAGQGSMFWFTVDLPESEASKRIVRQPAPVHRPAGAHILIAEDVKMNQTMIEAMLQGAGHRVTFADDGRKVVEAFHGGDYDMILMDVSMPEMDGLAATRAIRALGGRGKSIPIVALTANAMADEVASCKTAGMNDHLSKPIDRDALLRMVDAWSHHSRLGASA